MKPRQLHDDRVRSMSIDHEQHKSGIEDDIIQLGNMMMDYIIPSLKMTVNNRLFD
jgi:hypothetical protein